MTTMNEQSMTNENRGILVAFRVAMTSDKEIDVNANNTEKVVRMWQV